jgi:gentisate 1,2-dioxygenase
VSLVNFGERVAGGHMVALWEVMRGMLPPEPRPAAGAHHWRREAWRAPLLEAGSLISAEQAERRVLLLENPATPGEFRIASTLHAGLQLLLPGETAPPHRHSQAALRFVVEGSGAYTAVDGERVTMNPGDFILTPPFAWHEHGHPGAEPVIWLDGLDLPLVRLLDTTFAQFSPERDPISPTRPAPRQSRPSATFAYPYTAARAALTGEVDPCLGIRRAYTDPATGGHVMPTLAAYLQRLPAGFRGERYRTTEALVFCVVEGRGRTTVDRLDGTAPTFDWAPGDLFVVPGWLAHRHEAGAESVLFAFSDAAAQQNLGLWRELRGA